MRKYTKIVGALAAASALVAGNASAEIEGQVQVGYATEYEFRFVDLGSDLIEAGVDLSYALNENWGLKAGAWYGSTNDNYGSFNELDLYAAVGTSVGPVDIELGYIYYWFPDAPGTSDTQEVYASAFVDAGFGISAGATFFYDFDANNGWYLQPELRKSFEFNECLSLNLSVGAGFADGLDTQVDTDLFSTGSADGFQGWFVKAELPWEFREGVTLSPYIKYADADSGLAGDVNSLQGGQEHLIGGVKLAVGF
ncbi:hypothetical protein OKA04_13625 [Luteolibacter flavescens]|uniref:Uncharacterized protein n=1 Tax=Luteolibacter flavescens TaxID=1859460 RepID=A0ABT3FS17_9BACT|nr:hypothetical protein [Luteolibacter flavescens]MCW1885775.1 hypothetical protein [Luteolibacter flavescens]